MQRSSEVAFCTRDRRTQTKYFKAKKKKKKKKKKRGGGSLIRVIIWAQNYVSGQSAN